MPRHLKFFSMLLLLIMLVPLYSAHATLRVSKARLEFNPGDRTHSFYIINASAKSQTYRLDFIHYLMQENYNFKRLKEEEKDSFNIDWADDILRIAPRRITIPAGSSQLVRVALRPKKDTDKTKEYRSHIWIRKEAEVADFAADDKKAEDGYSVKLKMETAIAIPAFVRMTNLDGAATIQDAQIKIKDDIVFYNFTLFREGPRSLYGDFEMVCKDEGKDIILHAYRGAAIYPEKLKYDVKYKGKLESWPVNNCNNAELVFRSKASGRGRNGLILATVPVSILKE